MSPNRDDDYDTILQNISAEVIRCGNRDRANCPKHAGDVKRALTALQAAQVLSPLIHKFEHITVMMQLPGDADLVVAGEQYLAEPRTGEYKCFTRDVTLRGICRGPWGIAKAANAIGGHLHTHDVVIVKFTDGRVVLVDNGIGQFDESPFSPNVWLWVNVKNLVDQVGQGALPRSPFMDHASCSDHYTFWGRPHIQPSATAALPQLAGRRVTAYTAST